MNFAGWSSGIIYPECEVVSMSIVCLRDVTTIFISLLATPILVQLRSIINTFLVFLRQPLMAGGLVRNDKND
jgi:hypothetical protein